MTKKSFKRGFTVLELIVAIVFLLFIGGVFVHQKNKLAQQDRDSKRKIAINALYFNLKDVYYPKNKFYPENLTTESLPGVDPAIYTDPNGNAWGSPDSNYSYETTDCTDNKCQNFKLSAKLENEADFVKKN